MTLKKAFLALFLLAIGASLSSCVQPSPPDVKYVDHSIGRVTADGFEVNFNFEAANPNPLQLDVSGYSYKVFINDKELASADQKGFSLPASGKTKFTVPAFIRYDQLFGTVLSLVERLARGEKTIDYRVEGTVSAGVLGLTVSSPLKAAGKIPIPKNIQF
ncbi:MAG: LEA type 2 family protein [Candidatus Saganbacteria bacterium]|nr:LEA type 2 family protein [Candidatus Saganbacteria bacterium]